MCIETTGLLFPHNGKASVRNRFAITQDLLEGQKIVNGKIDKRDMATITGEIESIMDFARRQSFTYSEFEQFLELVKLTAFDHRVR